MAGAPSPDKALRVAFVSYQSHPQKGGQGVYVREVARALIGLGHEVTVVSGPPYPELPPAAALVRLPALDQGEETTDPASFRPHFPSLWPDLAERWIRLTGGDCEPFGFGQRLKAWLAPRLDRFDIVHDNQGLFATLPHLGLPAMATLHHPITVDLGFALEAEPDPQNRRAIVRRHGFLTTQARVARALPAILTVSEASKARIVSDFSVDPARIRVSPCGVDHETFHIRPEITRDPKLVVSTVSSDLPHKGLALLFEAMAAVVSRFPEAQLQIVGELHDGPAKDAIARLGLQRHVVLGGRMNPVQMAGLFVRAGVAVSPSLFEGFGLPAAEAMACGAPVVVTDGGAPPEVVGDAGLVVPAGNAAALGEAIVRLLGDEGLRTDLGRRGAARAKARFSWRDHALAATAAYRDAMAGTTAHS